MCDHTSGLPCAPGLGEVRHLRVELAREAPTACLSHLLAPLARMLSARRLVMTAGGACAVDGFLGEGHLGRMWQGGRDPQAFLGMSLVDVCLGSSLSWFG